MNHNYHVKISILIIIFFKCISLSYSQSYFSNESALPPIKIQFDEFINIIEKSDHLISKYDSLYNFGNEELKIVNDDKQQIIENFQNIDEVTFEMAKRIDYQFSNYSGSITRIDLQFSDFERTIRISGSNQTEINTISDLFKKEFLKHRNYFGGYGFRFAISAFILISSLLLIIVNIKNISSSEDKKKYIIYTRNKCQICLGLFLLIILSFISWKIIDLKEIFPGFAIFKENIGFIDKYANHFAFWGFILAIIAFFSFDILKKKKTN